MSSEIRNFCIIAHIDHGKSTLADRMMDLTGIRRSQEGQSLDSMDLEQERGITIKMTPLRMSRKGVELNLIDTPGHVDFQYEVSRSLSAVEGAVLLVDASQGIQAQTLSTLYMAMEEGLEIIPVLNKIDLPAAQPERVAQEIENLLGIASEDIIKISAKTGMNVDQVLDKVIASVPAPSSESHEEIASKALIFDSVYDEYRGVVVYVKVIEGSYKTGDKVFLPHSESSFELTEVGHFSPHYEKDTILEVGQIGYLVTGEKSVREAKIGDTILKLKSGKLSVKNDYTQLLPYVVQGFEKAKPFVYAGVYPIDTVDYTKLKDAFEKLSLNDSAISFESETSKALGLGFRCGFLGMLHMDIVKERLSREYDVETLFTTPTVAYLVQAKGLSDQRFQTGRNITGIIDAGLFVHVIHDFAPRLSLEPYQDKNTHELAEHYEQELKQRIVIRSGADMIPTGDIESIYEPIAEIEIVGPEEYAGSIMELVQDYRGELLSMDYLDQTRVVWKYDLPMGEMVVDFYDALKSVTRGYATLNYEFKYYRQSSMVVLDILINEEKVEAFSLIVHNSKAYRTGARIVEKLKTLIPKHLFVIPLQAAIGTKIIARETIGAMRKDVTAKLYGGDVTRKRKLLEKQKEGKKRMKAMGNVSIPGDVFIKMVTKD